MRILLNDHAGHAFPIQLSRTLAGMGHEVLHTYCGKLQTPRGDLERNSNDPSGFRVEAIDLGRPFNRYSLLSRPFQERELGRLLAARASSFAPDVVISSQTPLGTQAMLLNECRKMGSRFIFWLQDLLGIGIKNNVSKKIPILGKPIGWFYMSLERNLLRKSDEVVVITEDFVPVISKGGVAAENIHVIHNWAPLNDMPRFSKANAWSRKHNIDDKFCFLYAGTLGMKHNPELLVELAKKMSCNPQVRVVVLTEGLGADFLTERKRRFNLDNLIILPFQPFKDLPLVLASANVLLAILEPDAGVFAVPSKVLTYLCTERPLLLAVPPENLAARIVEESRAGVVVPPSDLTAFLDAAVKLLERGDMRGTMAANGRAYAERAFNIDKIAARFEEILAG